MKEVQGHPSSSSPGPRLRAAAALVLRLGGGNFLLLGVLTAFFLGFAHPAGWGERIFLLLAWVSTATTLTLVPGLVSLFLVLVFPKKKVLAWGAPLLFWVTFCLIGVDLAIFRIFKFHINGLVLNVVTTPGAGDSLTLGFWTYLTASLVALGVLVLEFLLGRWAARRMESPPPGGGYKKAFYLPLLLLLLGIAEKALYAAADLRSDVLILRDADIFPLYQRVTMGRFARKYLGIRPKPRPTVSLPKGASGLAWPARPLRFRPGAPRPNILVIAIESWRFDLFTKENAPELTRFARQCLVFRRHYSGGNCSRFGLFSLIYGLHGPYWFRVLNERRSPVLLDALEKLGYSFRIQSSTDLNFPEFRKTAFVKHQADIDDHMPGRNSAERDKAMFERLLGWIDRDRPKDRPFFAFLFLDAPHEPYSYPPEFEKFKPVAKKINFLTLNPARDAPLLRNRFKNSALWDDHLIGKALEGLKKRGLLQKTVIAVTGDHGQEFMEHGFLGHNSAFDDYQTRVTLLLHVPGGPTGEVREMTSHVDLPPTLLGILGCENPPSDYCFGNDLLKKHPPRRFALASGWSKAALIDPGSRIVFGFRGGRHMRLLVETPENRLLSGAEEEKILAPRRPWLLQVARELGRFLR